MSASYWYAIDVLGDPEKVRAAIALIQHENDLRPGVWNAWEDHLSGGGSYSCGFGSDMDASIRKAVDQFGVDLIVALKVEDEDTVTHYYGPHGRSLRSRDVLQTILDEKLPFLLDDELRALQAEVQQRLAAHPSSDLTQSSGAILERN
jgi:hypothetical protein